MMLPGGWRMLSTENRPLVWLWWWWCNDEFDDDEDGEMGAWLDDEEDVEEVEEEDEVDNRLADGFG